MQQIVTNIIIFMYKCNYDLWSGLSIFSDASFHLKSALEAAMRLIMEWGGLI